MRTRLDILWKNLTDSFWFVPSLLVAIAVGGSFLTLSLDRRYSESLPFDGLWYMGSPEGARAVLTTIAASMITTAGVVFSITVVALSLVSNQYGSRLLRAFMSSTLNQVVLGAFTSTFLFCLLTLRVVRTSGQEFVPHISVTVALVLALGCCAILIFFIHHVGTSVQVDLLLERLTHEGHATVKELYPERLGEAAPAPQPAFRPPPSEPAAFIRPDKAGFVQAVSVENLLECLTSHDLVAIAHYYPGEFVQRDDVVLTIWRRSGDSRTLESKTRETLRSTFVIGAQRTTVQDVRFALRQIVEIAVRALSPGINDPFTAVSCTHRLEELLSALLSRREPNEVRMDREGIVRIRVAAPTFADICADVFRPLRHASGTNAQVGWHLAQAVGRLLGTAMHENHRSALRDLLVEIADNAHRYTIEADRERLAAQVDGSLHKHYLRQSTSKVIQT